jgi:GNAT superfamily N-acetyltransferase
VESTPTVRTVTGTDIESYIPKVAQLRIRVFREFPYLYDGDRAYEERYLRKYSASSRGVLVLAEVDDEIVGASTALPLRDADDEFVQPFVEAGIAVDGVFYLGESVLEPHYRGLGIGHRFFDEREGRAADFGFAVTAFCAVVRPADHPLRPESYRPHDGFWSKRGYERRPDLVTRYAWRDLGDERETGKAMVFWIRKNAA